MTPDLQYAVTDMQGPAATSLVPVTESREATAPRQRWDDSTWTALKQLRSSLLADGKPVQIAVVSCFPQEGVTTLAKGLTDVLTEACGQVRLVDASATCTGSSAHLREAVSAARDARIPVIVDAGSLRDGHILDLTGLIEGAVLVVEAGRCRPDDIRSAVKTLQRAGIKTVGSVVNRSQPVLPSFIGD